MKTQMKFQKILTLASLLVGALVFVFAICFISGNLAELLYYNNSSLTGQGVEAIDTFYGADSFNAAAQTFVDVLVILAIVYICAVAVLYITSTNSRRNYYITNYVAIGLFAVVAAAVAMYLIIDLSVLLGEFANVDWDGMAYLRTLYWGRGSTMKYYLAGAPEPDQSVTMFILGYVVAVIILVNIAAWALVLLWKIKLMKGEKELLAKGACAEVTV